VEKKPAILMAKFEVFTLDFGDSIPEELIAGLAWRFVHLLLAV
jgi:hypothetical protein